MPKMLGTRPSKASRSKILIFKNIYYEWLIQIKIKMTQIDFY